MTLECARVCIFEYCQQRTAGELDSGGMEMARHSGGSSTDVSFALHAELLPNIRQITLHFSQTPVRVLNAVQPKFQLSDSGQEVTVSLPGSFQSGTQTITLPARVSDATQQIFKTDASPSANLKICPGHEYSIRMQIDPTHPLLTTNDGLTDDYVPWTAMDMSLSTRIRCRFCRSHLLKARSSEHVRDQPQSACTGWIWKDLPSGNWAEMMDFWHCHKPDSLDNDPPHETNDIHQTDDKIAEVKGYGAASRVKAIPGTVLIDVATFLLAESDCVGLTEVRLFPKFIPNHYSDEQHTQHNFTLQFFSLSFLIVLMASLGQPRRRPYIFRWCGLRYNCPISTICLALFGLAGLCFRSKRKYHVG